MGILSRLFGKQEPVQEAPQPEGESKENKDLLWERISEVMAFGDNQLKPELVRAQQKKWVRATFSDFRNFHIKVRDFKTKVERDTAKIEAVPMQSAIFQEYSKNIVSMLKQLTSHLKSAENQLSGERNITEITNSLTLAVNSYDEVKDYWANKVRKQFLE
jgi:hypothetical protein